MLSGLAQTGMKALGGARFSLVNLVPATILVGFLTLLAVSGLYAGDDLNLGETTKKLGANPGWALVAVFGVFVLAVLLRPFQAALVQLLEGYWERWPVLNHVSALAIERHRRARHTAEIVVDAYREPGPSATSALHEVAQAQRLRRRATAIKMRAQVTVDRYPKPLWEKSQNGRIVGYDDRLLPTLLGNALRDGEDNAGQRYGLSIQVVAPRLYPSLSPKLDAAITQSLDLLDTTAAMCVSFAVAAVSSLPLIGRWDPWSFTPLAAVVLSVLAYRGAVRIARGHARLLATACDLHRFDMLAALHYELPTTPQYERQLNLGLSKFLDSHGTALDYMGAFNYVHPEPTTSLSHSGTERAEPEPDGGGSAG